jgi:hypothetical protein
MKPITTQTLPLVLVPVPVKNQEFRQSQRLEQKNTAAKGTGKTKSKSSGVSGTIVLPSLDIVASHFPFSESTDSDVIHLFETCGFSLGKTKLIRMQVVNKFRTLMKDRFIHIIDSVQLFYGIMTIY